MEAVYMLGGIAVFLLIFLLHLCSLPFPRVRLQIINVQYVLFVTTMFLVQIVCCLFFVRPDTIPEVATTMLAPLTSQISAWLPGSPVGLAWLVVSATLVAIMLPIASLLDGARKIAQQSYLTKVCYQQLSDQARLLIRAFNQLKSRGVKPSTVQAKQAKKVLSKIEEVSPASTKTRSTTVFEQLNGS